MSDAIDKIQAIGRQAAERGLRPLRITVSRDDYRAVQDYVVGRTAVTGDMVAAEIGRNNPSSPYFGSPTVAEALRSASIRWHFDGLGDADIVASDDVADDPAVMWTDPRATDKAKHSPGPWRQEQYCIFDRNGNGVVAVGPGGGIVGTVDDGNARLIAAAPEMLALLRELGSQAFARTIDGCPCCGGEGGAHGDEWTDATGTIPCRIGALLARIDGKG